MCLWSWAFGDVWRWPPCWTASSPPQPAPGLAGGRGGEALGRAMLAGHPALSKVGRRRAERGRVALRQPGFTRAGRHAHRVGPSLEARCAAQRHGVLRAVALHAWAV